MAETQVRLALGATAARRLAVTRTLPALLARCRMAEPALMVAALPLALVLQALLLAAVAQVRQAVPVLTALLAASLSHTPDMADPYDTQDLAALVAMSLCKRDMPREFECGFGVYRGKDGKFYHTDVQSGGPDGIDGMKLRMPSTSTLVALGHTHPRAPDSISPSNDTTNAFSKEDVQYAKKSGMPMFMGSELTGQVVRFTPGQDKVTNHSTLGRISYGTPVGPYALPETATRREALEAAYDLHNQEPKK